MKVILYVEVVDIECVWYLFENPSTEFLNAMEAANGYFVNEDEFDEEKQNAANLINYELPNLTGNMISMYKLPDKGPYDRIFTLIWG